MLDSRASSAPSYRSHTPVAQEEDALQIVVTVVNGEKASSTHERVLDAPGLPAETRNVYVIFDDKTFSFVKCVIM